MIDIINKIKFEYVFAVLVILILSAALFVFREDKDLVNIIITCLVGAVSSITAFFFTKHNPTKDGDR
ncbi:MAG: hypothetical protein RR657_05090 [Peptostreptococcaceae bacterium]